MVVQVGPAGGLEDRVDDGVGVAALVVPVSVAVVNGSPSRGFRGVAVARMMKARLVITFRLRIVLVARKCC